MTLRKSTSPKKHLRPPPKKYSSASAIQQKPWAPSIPLQEGDSAGLFSVSGRAPEYIREDPALIQITPYFFHHSVSITSVCHEVGIPARTSDGHGPKYRFDFEVCRGINVDAPCVVDNNLVSGQTYHDNGSYF